MSPATEIANLRTKSTAGCLLTFCSPNGVDYLDGKLDPHLDDPVEALFDNEDASALAHISQAFVGSGTDTWKRDTVEWFLVYLAAELAVTPHSIRQGHAGISPMDAYHAIAIDLVRKCHCDP